MSAPSVIEEVSGSYCQIELRAPFHHSAARGSNTTPLTAIPKGCMPKGVAVRATFGAAGIR